MLMTSNRHMPSTPISNDEMTNHGEVSYIIDSFCLGQSADQKLDFLIGAIATNSDLTKAVVAVLTNFGNTINKEIRNGQQHKRHIV